MKESNKNIPKAEYRLSDGIPKHIKKNKEDVEKKPKYKPLKKIASIISLFIISLASIAPGVLILLGKRYRNDSLISSAVVLLILYMVLIFMFSNKEDEFGDTDHDISETIACMIVLIFLLMVANIISYCIMSYIFFNVYYYFF